jgi:hypothetical protein
MGTRPLTDNERDLISRAAEKLGDGGGERLLTDMESAVATPATADGSRIMFEIAGYKRPPYRGQHPFGVEGQMRDRDGTELSVLLHADENGRLLELEFVRWGDGDLIDPDWSTLSLL